MVDINKVLLTGTIGEPRLGWLESGKPELRLVLTVEQDGGFKLYVQVFCYGKDCERLAETLEAGDRVMIDGKLSWRNTVKSGVKESRMVVTCYGVDVLTPAVDRGSESPPDARAATDATPEASDAEEHRPEQRPRRRSYPKAALQGGFAAHPN
jgi:single-stranded DNA-binding protein